MNKLISKYYSRQFRNNKEGYLPAKVPYRDHLYGVKAILSYALYAFGEGQDKALKEDILNAALGHGLLEDTDIKEDEIVLETNERVLSLIKELTVSGGDAHTGRNMEQISRASEEARLIKYADLIENTTWVCHNMHVVGDEWYMDVYRPVLFSAMTTLEKTEFLHYPRTAEFLRHTLRMFAELLHSNKHIPLQYPIKAARFMREAISAVELEEQIEKSTRAFQKFSQYYRAGIITSEEKMEKYRDEFHEGFYDFLRKKRLRTRFNERTLSGFLEDYSLYRQGKREYSSQSAEPWLLYDDSLEASDLDKTSFFKLMEAFHIPAEYFEPLASSCIMPKWRKDIAGSGTFAIISFSLIDDGGWIGDSDPVGKTFTFTDELGLKAVIKIERRATKEDDVHNTFRTEYVGSGTIEGYTSERIREIRISAHDKVHGISFYTRLGNDDLSAFMAYPLWADYVSRLDKCNEVQISHLEALMGCFDS